MLPRSPPLPLIHRTVAFLPSRGSNSSILELVFPPPKFVMRKSDPNRLDLYRRSSASSRLLAIRSSQRSSRNWSFSLVFMRKTFASFQGIELADHFTGKLAAASSTIRLRDRDCNIDSFPLWHYIR